MKPISFNGEIYIDEDVCYFNECEVIKETPKALLINIPYIDDQDWIPKSQIHDNSEIYEDKQKGVLALNLWLVEKKGWI